MRIADFLASNTWKNASAPLHNSQRRYPIGDQLVGKKAMRNPDNSTSHELLV